MVRKKLKLIYSREKTLNIELNIDLIKGDKDGS